MLRFLFLLTTSAFAACTLSPRAADEPVRAAIASARAKIDTAFSQRIFAEAAEHIAENVTVSGPVWRTVGRDKLLSSYQSLAAQRSDVVWTHAPAEVDVNVAWGVAAERGTWYEQWSEKDGRTELQGTYSALWRKTDGRWLLEAEVFVPMSCIGSAYCKPR